MAAGGFRLGEAFLEVGAKVKDGALDKVGRQLTEGITKNISEAVGKEMDKIQSFGHTTGSKTAIAMQAGFAGTGVWMFGDVQKGLAEVNTLSGKVGADGAENMGMLQQGVYELSREMGISQKEVIPGMYDAISAGIPQDNIFGFMETANKLAVGGVTDTQTAVDGLTTIVNAFGLEAEDAGEVSDMMFTTVKNGKTTIEELAGAMFQVAPLASEAGVGLDQVNAAMGTLTLSGTPTSVAATQVRSAIQGLLRPSEDMTAIMNEAGYESAQAAIEQEGLAGALQIVSDATGGNQGEMIKLLGSIEAFQASTGILKDDSKEYTRQLGEQQNALGATEDAYNTMDQTQSKGMQDLKVAWENFAIVVGEALAPALGKLSDILNSVMDFFSGLPKPVQQGIAAFVALATVLGPPLLLFYKYFKIWKLLKGLAMARSIGGVKAAFAGLGPVARGAMKQVSGIGPALTSGKILAGAKTLGTKLAWAFKNPVGAVKALWAVIMANPIVAIGVAVIALVALIIYHWDTIKEWFTKFWNWFKETAAFDWLKKAWTEIYNLLMGAWREISAEWQQTLTALKGYLTTVWNFIKQVFSVLWNVIKPQVTNTLNILKTAWNLFGDDIMKVVKAAFNQIKLVITTVIDIVKNILMLFMNIIQGDWGEAWDNIKNIFGAAWDFIKGTLKNVLNIISGILGGWFEAITVAFSTAWNAIVDFFRGIWESITGIFTKKGGESESFLANLWKKIKEKVVAVWNAIKDFFGKVWENLKQMFIDHLEFIWNLFPDWLQDIISKVTEVFTNIFNFLVEIHTAIRDFIGEILSDIWQIIKGLFTHIYETIRDKVIEAFNVVKEHFTKMFNFYKEILTKIYAFVVEMFTKMYDKIREWILKVFNFYKEIWNKIWGFIGPIIDKIVTRVTSGFQKIYNKVKEYVLKAFNYIRDKFNQVVDFFTDLKNRFSDAFGGMFDGIKEAFKSSLNWVIRKWNDLSFSIPSVNLPEWLGGGTVGGYSLSTPNIPLLADGGFARMAGAAIVGEKGPEMLHLPKGAAVSPLNGKTPGGGDIYISNITIDASTIEQMQTAADFFDEVRQEARSRPTGGRPEWLT